MDIGRTDGVGGPGQVGGPNKINRISLPSTPPGAAGADKVDLSLKAGLISKALGLPGLRQERIAEIKALIESGRFDTDARLEGALDRFLADHPDL